MSEKSNLSIFVIKRVAKEILAGESMYKILKTHIGYKGEFGLDFASLRLKMYQYKNKKLPLTTDKGRDFNKKNQRVPRVKEKGLSGIKGAVYRGEWQSFGINNWKDLLLYIFGEAELPKNKFEGMRGLENAVKILIEFKKSKNKIPRTTDKEMNGIRKLCIGVSGLNML